MTIIKWFSLVRHNEPHSGRFLHLYLSLSLCLSSWVILCNGPHTVSPFRFAMQTVAVPELASCESRCVYRDMRHAGPPGEYVWFGWVGVRVAVRSPSRRGTRTVWYGLVTPFEAYRRPVRRPVPDRCYVAFVRCLCPFHSNPFHHSAPRGRLSGTFFCPLPFLHPALFLSLASSRSRTVTHAAAR